MKERNKAVPAVYLILKKDDKILLLQRQGSGYFDGWYALPAGHVEAEELPIKALIRETKEEIGITIKPENITLVHLMYRPRHDETGERVDIFFTTNIWSGEITNKEPHKCGDLRWFSQTEMPENIVPYVKSVLGAIEQGVLYSEEEVATDGNKTSY